MKPNDLKKWADPKKAADAEAKKKHFEDAKQEMHAKAIRFERMSADHPNAYKGPEDKNHYKEQQAKHEALAAEAAKAKKHVEAATHLTNAGRFAIRQQNLTTHNNKAERQLKLEAEARHSGVRKPTESSKKHDVRESVSGRVGGQFASAHTSMCKNCGMPKGVHMAEKPYDLDDYKYAEQITGLKMKGGKTYCPGFQKQPGSAPYTGRMM